MVRAGVKPTATTYTALISAYGKQGKVEQAMGIFADMVARGCERNVITYSSLISAAEKAGRTDLALQLFERMHQEGCRPNVVTYNSLIAACSHGAHWEDAERCFQQMAAQGCTPDGITYSALITAFERGGQWRRALGAYAQMTAQGCHPDSAVYNALLGACWSSGVAMAQMRASLIWSAANRSGHFRVYHQAKSDPAVFQHSCVAFTAGAAIITLLRWLVDIRHRMMRDGQGLLRDRVVFNFQKGKACRVEQPSALIRDALAAALAGAASPFEVALVDGATTRVEAESGALAAWLRSPAFAPLAFVAHAAAAKRMTLETLILEDQTLEARCNEALALVRSYEHLRCYSSAPKKQAN
ncbi:Pentatricopeptide repeat-containing protein [Monoraphidium neglectum]|uniref:Pentatricopeptide repeat-containing protein n=1 Tax=Monoraphidium neglectum TaxID=145388 RepID=A0A0D2LLC9_9CHLO|nr:Pentatricopeptide repeat-containing protein [Monoraphidium neglectum]KIY92629.1 Pentatricopeptide repeat-containing protein [Monoraphidium neglectum]|eukprot:XP_013891649.1 Pentatricopeptide repeat-containing protein [Monoraphidium neglectum]